LEDPRVHRNCLAQERHVIWSKEQHVADANQQATQRVARNDAQIATDANKRVAQTQTSECSKFMGTH
jgi:hypothetical protein